MPAASACGWAAWMSPLASALGKPATRAGASADSAPLAGSGVTRQATSAVCIGRSAPHPDVDLAVVRNAAAPLEGIVARIGHVAILDRQAVAIGRVAVALFGLDHDAPAAIEGSAVGRCARRSKCRRCGDQQGNTVSEHCILAGKQHGPGPIPAWAGPRRELLEFKATDGGAE